MIEGETRVLQENRSQARVADVMPSSSLRHSGLHTGLHVLPDDPVGRDVLIPGFRAALSVKGGFGWFSSGWADALAPGLAEYLNRDETAPIEFTVAPALFEQDREAIRRIAAT